MAEHTAAEMVEMLRAHYIAPRKLPSGYFAPELAAPDSDRRADLIWLPLTAAERGQIVGHEVKVHRADVVQELADPTKADAWAKYCTRWWLVVASPALVDGLDVPDHWGIMAPSSGRLRRTMTVLRPAPKLRPTDRADALATLMARMFNAGDDAAARMTTLEQERDTALRRAESLREQYDRAAAQLEAVGARYGDAQLATEIVAALRTIQRADRKAGSYRHADAHEIATAAVDLHDARNRTRQLISNLDTATRRVEQLAEVRHLMEGFTKIARDLDQRMRPMLTLPSEETADA